MKSRIYSVRLKEDFADALEKAHPEGVSTWIRKLVEATQKATPEPSFVKPFSKEDQARGRTRE
jgi:hypothetical protein